MVSCFLRKKKCFVFFTLRCLELLALLVLLPLIGCYAHYVVLETFVVVVMHGVLIKILFITFSFRFLVKVADTIHLASSTALSIRVQMGLKDSLT